MIAVPRSGVPVPDAVAVFAGRLLPARVQAAEAARLYAACRGPQYAEARQHLQARLRAANKILAAHNPGLAVRWTHIPTLITKEEQ